MRFSERNKQTLWYANRSLQEGVVDDYGNAMGVYKPIKTALNVSVVSSDSEVMMFGVHASDTIVIVANKDELALSETSILWWGITPTIKADGTTDTPHNYRVVGMRPSLNVIRVYAQRVSVS